MKRRLDAAGFTNIINVLEGMLGSGYRVRDLPLRARNDKERDGQIV